MKPRTVPGTGGRQKLEEDTFNSYIALQVAWQRLLIDNGSTDGLSFGQINAITAIRDHQPIPSRRLGQLLGITPGAVTQLIDVLVKEGLVARQENTKDRRVSELTLTEEGASRLAWIMQRRRDTFVGFYKVLSDEEMSNLHFIIQKLLRHLETVKK